MCVRGGIRSCCCYKTHNPSQLDKERTANARFWCFFTFCPFMTMASTTSNWEWTTKGVEVFYSFYLFIFWLLWLTLKLQTKSKKEKEGKKRAAAVIIQMRRTVGACMLVSLLCIINKSEANNNRNNNNKSTLKRSHSTVVTSVSFPSATFKKKQNQKPKRQKSETRMEEFISGQRQLIHTGVYIYTCIDRPE